ncbi:MAG: hypothetical protein EB127_08655 [Alphaproteobacteria bacterium]|nr:hypothetical protein [Alphaproteobacteria bacterium]
MRTVYILEAFWRDTIGRSRKQYIVGVYENLENLEKAKQKILDTPHHYTSVTFGINAIDQICYA